MPPTAYWILHNVGISRNVPSRLYQHFGTAYSWERNGQTCHFPNMGLAGSRPWLAESTRQILRKGEFQAQIFGVKPREYAALPEAFVIACCVAKNGVRPEVNAQWSMPNIALQPTRIPLRSMRAAELRRWYAVDSCAIVLVIAGIIFLASHVLWVSTA